MVNIRELYVVIMAFLDFISIIGLIYILYIIISKEYAINSILKTVVKYKTRDRVNNSMYLINPKGKIIYKETINRIDKNLMEKIKVFFLFKSFKYCLIAPNQNVQKSIPLLRMKDDTTKNVYTWNGVYTIKDIILMWRKANMIGLNINDNKRINIITIDKVLSTIISFKEINQYFSGIEELKLHQKRVISFNAIQNTGKIYGIKWKGHWLEIQEPLQVNRIKDKEGKNE